MNSRFPSIAVFATGACQRQDFVARLRHALAFARSAAQDGFQQLSTELARTIASQALCLQCHGTREDIRPEARAAIQAAYPDDKATLFLAS